MCVPVGAFDSTIFFFLFLCVLRSFFHSDFSVFVWNAECSTDMVCAGRDSLSVSILCRASNARIAVSRVHFDKLEKLRWMEWGERSRVAGWCVRCFFFFIHVRCVSFFCISCMRTSCVCVCALDAVWRVVSALKQRVRLRAMLHLSKWLHHNTDG